MNAALVVFWMASGVLPALGVLMASARGRRRSKGAQRLRIFRLGSLTTGAPSGFDPTFANRANVTFFVKGGYGTKHNKKGRR